MAGDRLKGRAGPGNAMDASSAAEAVAESGHTSYHTPVGQVSDSPPLSRACSGRRGLLCGIHRNAS